MRPPACSFVAAFFIPWTCLVAQQPHGALVPVGARVKAEPAPSGGTAEGVVVAWRGDTVVVRRAEGGDTVRLAAAALKKLRVVESPTVWRYSSPSDINFFASGAVPRAGGTDPTAADPYRDVLLIANQTELAGVDPASGEAIWTRKDLPDLRAVALDFIGASGYGMITRGEKMELIDFRTGERRWDTGALSLLTARGWLYLPGKDTLLLMYGRTAESPWTLIAVELATGKVRWRQDKLFAVEPKVWGTGGVSYLLGHQPPLADTDTTFVLYLSTEGPIRVDARTGAFLWRGDALHEAKIPALRDGYARIARRQGVLFVPSEKRLVALNVSDGKPAWPAPRALKSQAIRMEVTRSGLLVRGDEWLDLLDPTTGRSQWSAPVVLKNSTRIVLRRDTVYVAADNKLLVIHVPDGSARTVATVSFKEGEMAGGFGVAKQGFMLNSWHNLMLVDPQGTVRYHHVYPSPKVSFGEALKRGAGSDVMRPTTRWLGDYVFFFTGDPDDGGHEGFSVVKVDPTTGRDEARLWFDARVPAYTLETGSTVFYRRNDREIDGLKFADRSALTHAARNGHAALVERLLGMGVDPNAATDDGWTALHAAARAGHADVLRLLLSRGARVDAKTKSGWTPWMLAAREGHDEAAQSLREAADGAGEAVTGLVTGWHLAEQGHIPEALAAYAAAQALDSTLTMWPAAWQHACWRGGLSGQAAAVLALCDKAVARTPPDDDGYASARFARGLVRGLTGNFADAAADLEPSLDPEEEEGLLSDWIDALRSGRNPFTPTVLASLQGQ
jgi:hypothetical protein